MRTTTEHSKLAAKALADFSQKSGISEETLALQISDLLADLMHLCGENAVDFIACIEQAMFHYIAELKDAENET